MVELFCLGGHFSAIGSFIWEAFYCHRIEREVPASPQEYSLSDLICITQSAANPTNPTNPTSDHTDGAMFDQIRQQRQKLLDPESQKRETSSGSFREELSSLCPSLTYQERVIGCVTCFTLGFLLSLGATFRLAKLAGGHPGPFAMAFTIGNLLSLASSMFFVGPCKQAQTMFHSKRRVSALVYLVFIGFTLALCFSPRVPHRVALVLVCVTTQFLALVWYTLSYVPYGRSIARSCCKRMCGATDDDV